MPPGLRKSGIPDSVLMPAPVKTTARFARSISRARAAMPLSLFMAPTLANVPGRAKGAVNLLSCAR